MKNIGIILAGGLGSRLGLDVPKQFMKIEGKMIIEHAIDSFEKSKVIDEIVIVIHPDYIEEMKSIAIKNQWNKVKNIIEGGSERYQSTLAALKLFDEKEEINMIFHDAARPMVSQQIIEAVVDALQSHEAVGTGIPVVDTIAEIKPESREIADVPQRNTLYRMQTPQGFRLSTIRKAFDLAKLDFPLKISDDCGVVFKYLPEVPIYIIPGDEKNIKLTYESDIYLLEKLFNAFESPLK